MSIVTLKFESTPSISVLQKRAEKFRSENLEFINLWPAHFVEDDEFEVLTRKILLNLNSIHNQKDKFFYGAELMRILTELKTHDTITKLDLTKKTDLYDAYLNGINEIIYFIQSSLEQYSSFLQADVFSDAEARNLSGKVDDVLSRISNLEIGQQLIYDDLYASISELKTFVVLGKRNYYQKILGILSQFGAEKAIEEIWELVSPKLKEIANSTDFDKLLTQ